MSADAQPMDVDEQEIDENLYSRQLYVIDHASMKRVMGSNVLLLGLGGLGVEIAKNVILTGVKSLTIWDPVPASKLDLASQFYLTEEDVAAGTSRAEASRGKLEELNPYVDVKLHSGKLTDEFLARFQVIVATDTSLEDQLRINGVCRANGAKFIAADIRGVSSSVFCDFGSEFVVHDKNGEALRSYMISSITKESPGAITLIEDARCDLETGDYVVFKDVEGMVELNDQQPVQVTVKGPYALEVADTSKFSAYTKGGVMQEVKMPVTIDFLSLEAAIAEPEFFLTDFAKFETPGQLHVAFMALHEFRKRNSRLPGSHSAEDCDQLLSLAKEFNAKHSTVEEVDAAIIRQVSFTAMASISPMAAFVGGVVGQEVLKACTGKFTPIKQWMYFDAKEMLPAEEDPALFQPQGSRYDSQTIVFGRDVQDKVLNLKYFLVGAGAIGCELLKNWACMGVGAAGGMIHVTDMDTIEKSNLNRQFLFRPRDVSRLKSETAAEAVAKMNPSLNIKPYALRVGAETENIFNNGFYGSLSGVCNALDNVEARMYMDSQCINHRLSLLESGTLGTKGNTQVIVPDLTESYASSRDPPEKTIPMCTLHHFPNRIEHTIQWARDSFEGIFASAAENVNAYLSQANFLEVLQKQSLVSRLEIVKSIHSSLVSDRPLTFAACIAWARLRFEEYFNNNIQQLLFNFPKDLVTSSGAPFWSGPKKAPSPLQFDASNEEHMAFIVAAANLRAFNYGLNGSRDPAVFLEVLPTVQIPAFKPKSNVAIPASDAEAAKAKENGSASNSLDADEKELEQVQEQLPQPETLVGYRMEPAEFEKDVDENFHIDFITACSNLRASNYSIAPADKHKTKGIAGKIIPAMVTTTAMITGLVCIEMMKLVQKKKLEDYKNGFANLAIPFIAFSEPQAPEKVTVRDGWSWSLWDRFDVKGPKTLQEILDYFQEEHQLEVTMASAGMTLIYAFFHKKDTLKARLAMELTDLVESVSKKPVDRKAGIQLTVCCSREEDGEDVEVPWVNYTLESVLSASLLCVDTEMQEEEQHVDLGDGSSEEEAASPQSFNDMYRGSQFKPASYYKKRRRRTTIMKDTVGVGLQFTDVSYSARSLLGRMKACVGLDGGGRDLIHNVSGYVLPGQMMAVIGPSGAGKTTTLNVLSGRIKSGVRGDVTVGGISITNTGALARQYGAGVVAYVRQDDALYPHLTVYETLRYSAWLRLPSSYSFKRKSERVDYTIESLGLSAVRSSAIGDQVHPVLSGGEKRRVTIGVEIIKKPSVLFLDEPTSGLDSYAAMSTIQLLSDFAKEGNRAVVCTIHQPTEAMFNLFDSVLLLSHGRMMYFGDRAGMKDYFERVGFQFPQELPTPEFAMNIMRHYEEKNSEQVLESYFAAEAKDDLVGPAKRSMEVHNQDAAETETSALNGCVSRVSRLWGGDEYGTTWMEQFFYLSHRNVVNTLRTKDVFLVRVAVMLVLALCVGTMYLQLDKDEVQHIAAFLILSVTIVFFNSLEILPAFIRERIIFIREYGSHTYRLSCYVFSQFIVHLPFLAILAIAYGTPAYWLVGVNSRFHAFIYWLLVLFVCFICAQSIIIIVAILAPDAQLGNSVATALMAMLLFFCGFFLPPSDIPVYWLWFHFITPFKYAFEGLLVSNFNYDIECGPLEEYEERYDPEPCRLEPDEYLDGFDIAITNAWLNLLILTGFALAFRLVAFVMLEMRSRFSNAR